MTFKAGDVRRNLRKKGFQESKKGHHVRLSFCRDGKVTRLYTYVSHGKDKEDVGDDNVRAMKDQLGLSSKKEVERLVECSMDEEEYLKTLIATKKLPA